MRIFLTGATGFVGSHFVKEALIEGNHVFALRRTKESKCKIELPCEPYWINSPFDQINFDEFDSIDVLVHLAAHSANVPYDSLENCLLYNLTMPLKMFKAASNYGINKFLVTGSCFEYGISGLNYDKIPANATLLPTQSYPASKAAASIAFTQFARENNISLSLVRLFQIFGEGELNSRLYPSLKEKALSGEDFKMTKGEQIRDFMNVKDVAKTLLNEAKSLAKANSSIIKIQNIGSGKPKSILEFSNEIWKTYKAKGKLIPGALDYRKGEVMKFIPCLKPYILR